MFLHVLEHMNKLDHIDWEVIALLHEDGRVPGAVS